MKLVVSLCGSLPLLLPLLLVSQWGSAAIRGVQAVGFVHWDGPDGHYFDPVWLYQVCPSLVLAPF